jgi:Temperature dependent protein affecting M2 dsRNA replication
MPFHQPQGWSAPLSRELLVFNSFVRSLTRALRTLLEVTSLNLLLRNDARKARDDLLDIALSLPFQTEVNTGFGVRFCPSCVCQTISRAHHRVYRS